MTHRARRSVFLALGLSVFLAAGMVSVAGPAGSATPAWKIVNTPLPVGSTGTHLAAVACPSATNCFAVGYASTGANGTNDVAVVERWNGSTWTLMKSPSFASAAQLNAVACAGAKRCFAVGTDATGESLVEQWNGTGWSSATVPDPAGGNLLGDLFGVSCRSATSCIAVGRQGPPRSSLSAGLVESWNGSSWSVIASPNPTDPTLAERDITLLSVSCPAANSCFAVGALSKFSADFSIATEEGIVEHWDGSAWSVVTIPSLVGPAFGNAVYLAGVSCPTAKSCFAVGTNLGNPLIEHWDGIRWSVTAHIAGSALAGVSCPTPRSCFAVAAFGGNTTLVEHWTGSRWSVSKSPNPPKATSVNLLGVTCVSSVSCFAVGDFSRAPSGSPSKPLVERYA